MDAVFHESSDGEGNDSGGDKSINYQESIAEERWDAVVAVLFRIWNSLAVVVEWGL